MNTPIEKIVCERCHKEFTPKYVSPSRLLKQPRRFCKDCGRHNRANGQVVKCTYCHKDLYRRKSYLSSTKLPFCDHKCYGLWQRHHHKMRGAELREYRYNRRIALERDGYACRDCGETEKRIITHHIQEVGPDQANHHYTNLISLCDSCHRKRHHN